MIIWYLLVGVLAGIFGGLFGIGGGTIVIPVLVYLFGFTQHQAQGTSLAMMLPPVGLLAVWTYYNAGNVNLKASILLCIGFLLGGLLGAIVVKQIPDANLKKIFGIFLLCISLKMIFGK